MANNKDFIVKNAVEIGKGTTLGLGTISSSDLDLSTGSYFKDTLAANTTYTFSNPADVQAFTIEVTGASTYTITWPTSVQWATGSTPDDPSSGQTNVYSFITADGGTSYFGALAAENIS